jgi:hypothetical protein
MGEQIDRQPDQTGTYKKAVIYIHRQRQTNKYTYKHTGKSIYIHTITKKKHSFRQVNRVIN